MPIHRVAWGLWLSPRNRGVSGFRESLDKAAPPIEECAHCSTNLERRRWHESMKLEFNCAFITRVRCQADGAPQCDRGPAPG